MGSDSSKLRHVFSDEDLKAYSELTYLSSNEISRCYYTFRDLDYDKVAANKDVILPMETMLKCPALKANPFKDRICKVFSSTGDGSMSFEDFIDMMSTFNENAPKEVKIEYAFRIYDFDDDDFISKADLEHVMQRLLPRDKLGVISVEEITKKILQEADFDDDGGLSFGEFRQVMSKDPDFMRSTEVVIIAVDGPQFKYNCPNRIDQTNV